MMFFGSFEPVEYTRGGVYKYYRLDCVLEKDKGTSGRIRGRWEGRFITCAAVLSFGHDFLLEVSEGLLDLASLELLVIQARLQIDRQIDIDTR